MTEEVDARPLYSPARVRRLLARYGLRGDKAYGQNFLIDKKVLHDVVEAGSAGPHDTVLEVGPGLGVLTRELAARAARVVALELDERLLPLLHETLADLDNVSLLHADALRFDLTALPQGSLLISNLPYNIATTLIVRALESARFRTLTFLIQREVAERLAATAGQDAYGALSLIVAHYGQVAILRHVKATAFLPPPEVTSSLVRIDIDPAARPDPKTFELIRSSFRHRRKTLLNNLIMAGYERQRVSAALATLGVSERVRAEALDLATFRQLSKTLDV